MTGGAEDRKLIPVVNLLLSTERDEEETKMLNIEDKPYANIIEDWLKRIGYDAGFYENHTPVRQPGSVRRLTKRERERVDALSKERGYRSFQAITRTI